MTITTTALTGSEVACPLCRTLPVPTPTWDFSDTTVEIPVCIRCSDRTGAVSTTMRVSALIGLADDLDDIRASDARTTR